MKIRIFAVVCLLAANLFTISAQKWFTPEAEKQVDALLSQVVEGNYKNNRYPLLRKPLMELPLGSIKPKGWLHEMLVRQKMAPVVRWMFFTLRLWANAIVG